MTILHVTDQNTGEIVTVDLDNPTGELTILDAAGNLVTLDLSESSGIITAIDADTGNFITVDLSDPEGTLTVINPNTGEFQDIDLTDPLEILYIDQNSGEFIEAEPFYGLTGGDSIAPTVSISLSRASFGIGDTATITFTFSEAPINFTVADVTAPNGSLSSFTVTGNPLVYTATFTPTNSVNDSTNVITVGTNWTDAAGNSPASSTTSSNYSVNTYYSISGAVFDADGVTAVSGVTIALGALNTTTAANGTFAITNVPTGTSGSLTATKSNYSFTAIPVSSMNGNLTGKIFNNAWWAATGIASICVRAYQPIGAANLASSYINLVSPGTNNAAPGSAPTFSADTGWTFDGSNNYLTCGLTPPNNQTYSAFARFSDYNTGSTGRCLFGTYTANFGGFFGILPYISSTRADYNNGGALTHGTGRTSGVVGIAGNKAYYNGSSLSGTISTGGNSFGQVYIGAENDNPTAANKFNGKMQAIAFYSAALTPTQAAAVSAAMTNLPNVGGGEAPYQPLHSYANSVLALDPIAYWPCNETYYTNLHDETGNNRYGTAFNVTNNVSGKYGVALQFAGSSGSKAVSSANLTETLNPNEYSISAWVKVTVNAGLQVRIFNTWNSAVTEYSAIEIRNGDKYNLFFREGGSDQNITGGLPTATDGTWAHVVIFNSVSQDIMGMYYNGTKYQYSRSLAGMTGPVLEDFPEVGMQLQGCMQHIAFYDHALTQEEVNTICT